jgi:hypothetical protein
MGRSTFDNLVGPASGWLYGSGTAEDRYRQRTAWCARVMLEQAANTEQRDYWSARLRWAEQEAEDGDSHIVG